MRGEEVEEARYLVAKERQPNKNKRSAKKVKTIVKPAASKRPRPSVKRANKLIDVGDDIITKRRKKLTVAPQEPKLVVPKLQWKKNVNSGYIVIGVFSDK